MKILEQDISSSETPIGSILILESEEETIDSFIDRCKKTDANLSQIKELKIVTKTNFEENMICITDSLRKAKKEISVLDNLVYKKIYKIIEENTYSCGGIWVLETEKNYVYINWYRES